MRKTASAHQHQVIDHTCPITSVHSRGSYLATCLGKARSAASGHQLCCALSQGCLPCTIVTTCKRLQLQLQTAAPTNKQPTPKNLQNGQRAHPTQFRQQKCALICIALLGNARGLILRDRSKGADRCLQRQPAACWQLAHFKKATCALQGAQYLVKTNKHINCDVHVLFKGMGLLQQQCNQCLLHPG